MKSSKVMQPEGTSLEPRRAAARGLPQWLASCWDALQATQPHRMATPDDMMPQQVRIEPLAGNKRIAARAPGARPAVAWARATSLWGPARRVRDLAPAANGQLPAVLPQSWQAAVGQPPRPSGWETSTDGQWVRYVPALGPARAFQVLSDGRLMDPAHGQGPPPRGVAWQDACVVAVPPLRGRRVCVAQPVPPLRTYIPQPAAAGAQGPPPAEDLYIVGAWEATALDPALWGHGMSPITHYTVKAATLRLKQLDAAVKLQGSYNPTIALAPALWGPNAADHPDPQALAALAARQERVFQAKLAAGGPSAPRRRVPDDALAALYRQPWMGPSPPRALPADRAQQRAAQQAANAAPVGGDDDTTDALAPTHPAQTAWRAAWSQVQSKQRPRPHRVFEWQLMHTALPCGGARASFFPPDGEGLPMVACCGNAACRSGPPPQEAATGTWSVETLTHALLDCPAVRPALRWLARVWTRVEGGLGPPLTAAVWLQGDTQQWQPQRQHRHLWTSLRISLLAAAWELRTRRNALGTQFTPADVIARCVDDIRSLVLADWQRIVSRVTDMAGTHEGWFPGRDPAITTVDFEKWWCPGSVVAHVYHTQAPSKPRMEFRLEGR